MNKEVELKLFFNFRSPYCYLATKRMWQLFDEYHVRLAWRPFGAWDGRSPPERAKKKIPLVRQDVLRWCNRIGAPFVPPPIDTNPTNAALGSLYAEQHHCLREYVNKVMSAEWGEGKDIGKVDVLSDIAVELGLDASDFQKALGCESFAKKLADNKVEADELGVFGVPTFVVGKEIFWGNDRIDFVAEYLEQEGLAK